MAFARKYHAWIFEEIQPYLGERIVEVGAGIGSFSKLLLSDRPRWIGLVEPSEMCERLAASVAEWRKSTDISVYRSTFREVAESIEAQKPESIVYVNVLEHVADDRMELESMYRALPRNGRIVIFVPALPWLYGALDRRLGHYRRYRKTELEAACRSIGFTIVHSRYFDLAGVVGWWLKYKVLRSESLEGGVVDFYDRYVVPISKKIESAFAPPIGKNVLLVARK